MNRGPYIPKYAPEGSVGALIRIRRIELGLTHKAVAAEVGCAQSVLSLIESGRRSAPKDLLQKLAVALNMAMPS